MSTRSKRKAAQAAEQELLRQSMSSGANPERQLRIAKSRAKTSFTKANHKLLNALMRDSDESELRTLHATFTKAYGHLTDSIDAVMDVASGGMQDKLVEESDEYDHSYSMTDKQYREQVTEIISNRGSVTSGDNLEDRSPSRSDDRDVTSDQHEYHLPLGATNPHEKERSASEVAIDNPHLPKKADIGEPTHILGRDMWKQLTRVTIPKFNGDKRNYQSWRSAFYTCVDAAPATPEYKLLQLRNCLQGEALKCIETLGHTGAAYQAAKERLERKFGGQRRQLALHMDDLDQFHPMKAGSPNEIDKLADILDLLVINLEEQGQNQELTGNGSLYCKSLKKLTEPMITNYKRWVFENHKEESVRVLREWILREAEYATIANETLKGFGKQPVRETGKNRTYHNNSTEQTQGTCPVCKEPHAIWMCGEFKKMSLKDRWSVAWKKGLCYRCLRSKHIGRTCPRSQVCGIDGCSRSHSRFLHSSEQMRSHHEGEGSTPSQELSPNAKPFDSKKKLEFTGAALNEPTISLRTIPVILRSHGKSLKINAMMDDGSTRTYLNNDVAAQLGVLHQRPSTISVGTIGGNSQSFLSEEVSFQITSVDGSFTRDITAATTHNVTGNLRPVDWRSVGKGWSHLRNIQFPTLATTRKVDMILGVEHLELIRSLREVLGKPGEPIARLTPLGWTAIGPTTSALSKGIHKTTHFAFHACEISDQLKRNVERFWEIEEFSEITPELPIEEKKALDMVSNSITHDGVRYQVGMPWCRDPTEIESNIEVAKKRLATTERSITKRGLDGTYNTVLKQHLEKGYTRKVESNDAKGRWYLPHFAVVKPSRTTTKVRIVFDASANNQGECLNDYILKGPKLQRDLNETLIRFRRKPVAVASDVSEMYHQISLLPKDRPYQRFLWREKEDGDVNEYEFTRLVFGINSSPFQAQFVVRHHAEKYHELFPQAAEAILKSTYMDDTMDSVESDSDGVELYRQLSQLWKMAGMHAQKWISNSKNVLEHVPLKDRASEIDLSDSELPETKTLGISWKAEHDVFTFHHSIKQSHFTITKRTLLSSIALLFDPLGMLAPLTIRGKIILQEVWMLGMNWDDELPPRLTKKTHIWYEDLQQVHIFEIPRCLREKKEVVETDLHFFCDASEEAYALVGYVTCQYSDGSASSRQVIAKAKVAPLKTVSIPRLELMAAVMAAKMGPIVAKGLDFDPSSIHYWTDSTNVLWWIYRRSRVLKTFVANRVAKIQQNTTVSLWKHVPTSSNPADLGTRGANVETLNKTIWKNGPAFLTERAIWPAQKIQEEPTEAVGEVKATTSAYFTANSVNTEESRIVPTRYSTLTRLVRVAAWISRFADNCRRSDKLNGGLTVDELMDSEYMLIRSEQRTCFKEELQGLTSKRDTGKTNKLTNLNPFLDDDGILRSNSRLVNADMLTYETKHPIILPRKAWITKLIIRFYHQQNGHVGGTNQSLSEISKRFWIVHAREAIREVETSCNKCAQKRAKAANQQMAPLPLSRIGKPYRAFIRVAIDYAGPFEAIQGRGRARAKRYLCLFTCMLCRAVHLEMAFSLDTDSFLNAFFRFANRRGIPEEVFSDNGTNFVGGERELQEAIESLDRQKIVDEATKRRIKWNFNPPAAPHFGGVHESLIKTSKRAIYAVLKKADINDEELMTAITGAEEIVNSRPITYQSSNPKDDLPLTPNHFLHGRIGMEMPFETIDSTNFSMRIRWRRVQELVRHIWSRWIHEWLPALAQRKRWTTSRDNIKKDDIVLVMEANIPRGKWPLARVVETFPGKDGRVRTVKINAKGSTYIRPIVKIFPLELSEN